MTSLNLRVYHTVSSLSVEDKAERITVELENSRWKWLLVHYFRVRNYGFDFDLFDSRALEILSRDALASNSNQVDWQMFPFLCNVSFANCIFGLYRFREADSFFADLQESLLTRRNSCCFLFIVVLIRCNDLKSTSSLIVASELNCQRLKYHIYLDL